MNSRIAINRAIRWRALFALATGVSILLAAAGCSSHAAGTANMPAPEVSVAKVLVRKVRQWDDFTGRVAAVQSVELRARVSGYVDKVTYTEGRYVKQGDLLFVIDPRPYRAELAHAKAELARARSEAELARTQDQRAQKLVAAKAISRDESDTRHAAVAQAEAAARAAEAAVATAQLNLGFTEVRSPIDGRTGRAMITAGTAPRIGPITGTNSASPSMSPSASDEPTPRAHRLMPHINPTANIAASWPSTQRRMASPIASRSCLPPPIP